MIKVLLCFLWLLFIPLVLGMILTRKMEKYKNNLIFSWVLGYFIEFALFEILSVMIGLFTTDFNPLFYGWIVLICIIFIASIILNYKRVKEIFKFNVENIKRLPISLTIIMVILIGIQMYVPFRYMHVDDDDSNFVAKATTTYETNTFYKYDDKGEIKEKKDLRHELATFPIYTATIAKLIDINPAITAHTIFPVVFIPMAYSICFLIADNLFNGDKKKVAVFMILLSLIYIYGNYSRYSNFVRLLYRTWQGKSLVANITVPMLWLTYLDYSKNYRKNIYWITIIITMFASNLFSSMAVPLMPITLFALTVVYYIKDRKISDFLKSLVSVLPCLLCGILYLILG